MTNQAKGYIIICIGVIFIITSISNLFSGNILYMLNAEYFCGKNNILLGNECYNGYWGISSKYFSWVGLILSMIGGYMIFFGARK